MDHGTLCAFRRTPALPYVFTAEGKLHQPIPSLYVQLDMPSQEKGAQSREFAPVYRAKDLMKEEQW